MSAGTPLYLWLARPGCWWSPCMVQLAYFSTLSHGKPTYYVTSPQCLQQAPRVTCLRLPTAWCREPQEWAKVRSGEGNHLSFFKNRLPEGKGKPWVQPHLNRASKPAQISNNSQLSFSSVSAQQLAQWISEPWLGLLLILPYHLINNKYNNNNNQWALRSTARRETGVWLC